MEGCPGNSAGGFDTAVDSLLAGLAQQMSHSPSLGQGFTPGDRHSTVAVPPVGLISPAMLKEGSTVPSPSMGRCFRAGIGIVAPPTAKRASLYKYGGPYYRIIL
jgi:hypothetical protein